MSFIALSLFEISIPVYWRQKRLEEASMGIQCSTVTSGVNPAIVLFLASFARKW